MDNNIKRSTTFAGMDSYYKKSKTFHYGQSPEPKLGKIQEDDEDAGGLIELQQMDKQEGSNETDRDGTNAEKTKDGMF